VKAGAAEGSNDQDGPLARSGEEFVDADFVSALRRALRLVLVLAVVGTGVAWLALGWRSAFLYMVGAAISATAILVWQRLMGAVLTRFRAGGTPKPLVPVLLWFSVHLLLSGGLLYVSLKRLDGSVYVLIAGLGLALIALLIEALRLMKSWTL